MFVILIYAFLSRSLSDKMKFYFEMKKGNAIAQKHFDEFKNISKMFGEFIDTRRSGNMQNILSEIINNSYLNDPRVHKSKKLGEYTKEWYDFLMQRLEEFDGTHEMLGTLGDEFSSIMDMYNDYIIEIVISMKNVGREKIQEHKKVEYNNRRNDYEFFVRDYIKFTKKFNQEYGKHKFKEHFKLPEDL